VKVNREYTFLSPVPMLVHLYAQAKPPPISDKPNDSGNSKLQVYNFILLHISVFFKKCHCPIMTIITIIIIIIIIIS